MASVVVARTRSARLRACEPVYKEYMAERKKKKTVETKDTSELTKYQHFVKKEGTKKEYLNVKGSERMKLIAEAWEKDKRKRRKKEKDLVKAKEPKKTDSSKKEKHKKSK